MAMLTSLLFSTSSLCLKPGRNAEKLFQQKMMISRELYSITRGLKLIFIFFLDIISRYHHTIYNGTTIILQRISVTY